MVLEKFSFQNFFHWTFFGGGKKENMLEERETDRRRRHLPRDLFIRHIREGSILYVTCGKRKPFCLEINQLIRDGLKLESAITCTSPRCLPFTLYLISYKYMHVLRALLKETSTFFFPFRLQQTSDSKKKTLTKLSSGRTRKLKLFEIISLSWRRFSWVFFYHEFLRTFWILTQVLSYRIEDCSKIIIMATVAGET